MTSEANQPDKIYYDLVISNLNGTNNGEAPPCLSYNETRSIPILYNPSSYYLSIVRFSLDTPTLPVWTPEIQLQDDPNLTAYSFTLSWTDPSSNITYDAREFLRFIPQDETRDTPLPPTKTINGFQDNTNGYYYVYNYQYIIYLCNNTFTSCLASLQKQLPPGLKLPSNEPPVMAWNVENDRAVLYTDINGYDVGKTNCIKIFMNSNMSNLWNSFPLKVVSYSNVGDKGKNSQIITNSFGNANILPYPPAMPSFDAIVTYQEWSTIANINCVTSIVFCSNTLPIVPENISKPILFFNGSTLSSNGDNSLISQIITDLALDASYKPNILYEPKQYRLISMVGTQPLINVDVSVFWRDRIGQLNPFKLSAGSTCTLKFLFTKKSSE